MKLWKKIFKVITVILLTVVVAVILIYVGRVDWSRQHEAKVNLLPSYQSDVDHGVYRLMANRQEFLVRIAGNQNTGPGVVLLHGFPESSIMWTPLMDALSKNGYRVLSFDLRGYSPGARPDNITDYRIDTLVQDVLAVADVMGFDTFHLIGQDWGAAVGWKTVMDRPERIISWTAMSIPHIGVFFDGVLHDGDQKARSGYMETLRKPIIPELFFHLFKNRVYNGKESEWTKEQIDEYKAIFSEPGAFQAALNWYRAMNIEQIVDDQSFMKSVICPTLFIYGTDDPVISIPLIPSQNKWIDTTLTTIPLESGHSLMQERETEVINHILHHLNKHSSPNTNQL